jgi:hypothetical protein
MNDILRAGMAALAAMLCGCTIIETARLPDALAGKLQDQPVAIVVQAPASFGVMRERAVALGPAGIPFMVAQGEHLRKSAGIADPADAIATSLGDLLAQRNGAVLMPVRGATPAEEPESIVAAAPPGARYVLTVATVSWGLARFPVRDATYSVTYVARARLIDVRTKSVVAEGGCMQGPAGDEAESTDYGFFTADGAAVIKSELARRSGRCLHFIERDMLGT